MCVMAVTVVIINQLPFLLNFTLLLIVTLINPTSGCAYRKYNRDSYICVCSEYYCDSLLEVEDPGPDHVDVYETNRDGLRFQRSSIRLMPSDMTSQKWIHSGLHHVHVTLKPEIKYQKIIGFGGAFTDAACVNIMSLSTRMADSVIRDYFGTDGLEFNMAKVPIGSNEASRREYSLSPPMDFNLSNFALAEEDLWYKIPLIEKAKVVKPDLKLVASAGSAPHWMTEARMGSFDVAPLKNKPGTIFYKLWAAYQIKFLKAYESMGINFWGLTFANKPFSSSLPNGPEGVPMSPLDEKDFLKYDLGPLLKQAGYGRDRLKVFIMNDIISTAPYWSTIISSDDEAASYISGLAFTWYLKHHIKSSQFILNFLHERWPDYHLLSSEAMVGINSKEKVALGSWARAELYGIDIIEDLNHWTSGWLESSLALDMIGGPNKRSRFADSPVIVNAIYNEYYKQPTFYLLAHFTKFLGGPESIRIGNIIFKIVDNVYFLTALYNQDLAVVIVMNVNDYNLDVRIVGFSGGQLHRKIGSKSIQTYIGRIR